MSWSSIGSLGHTSSKSSGKTLTISPSRAVPAGRVVLVFAGWIGDRFFSDSLGEQDHDLTCKDSEGNVYTTVAGALYDASAYLFAGYIDNPLSTSSVITLTHERALTAKCVSLEEFDIGGPGFRFAVWRDKIVVAEIGPGGTLSGLGVSGLSSGEEYLIVHDCAQQRPVGDSYTYDTDYTPITTDGTTGGTASSNIAIVGQYRIVSGITTDNVDIANGTATANDTWEHMSFLTIIDYDPDFPTFPNLDDFNRADEDPVGPPKWENPANDGPGFQSRRIAVDGNVAVASPTTGPGAGSQFWGTPIPAGDDGEVGFTIVDIGVGGQAVGYIFCSGDGAHATLSGYALSWETYSTGRNRALFGYAGFSGTVSRFLGVWADYADGHKIGLQMREGGSILSLWVDDGTGWRWVSAYRASTVINGGKAGLDFRGDLTLQIDDFFAGTSIRFVPQIIRRPPDPSGARLPP